VNLKKEKIKKLTKYKMGRGVR